jgi:beta-galactosidase/beta-glucuronidase
MKYLFFLVIAGFFVTDALAAIVPSDAGHSISLNGTWRFKIEQEGDRPDHGSIGGSPKPIKTPAKFEPFEKLDYKEDGTWRDIAVPSNWEMSGHSLATYNQPDNAIGIYRLSFDIPADWKDRVVKINFEGIQNGAEIYLNGKAVNVNEPAWERPNYHECGANGFQADLTPTMKPGEKNLLAIRVFKNTKSVDLDTGDFFFLGGIHRSVTLFSVPNTHLEDLSVRTKLLEGEKAEIRVSLGVASVTSGIKATVQLEGQKELEGTPDDQGHLELVQIVDHPRLWSAEYPNLYPLTVHLKDEKGQTIEEVHERAGIREVSIRDGILLVNHVPVKLTGICRHDLYADVGSAFTPELYRKELLLMKAANINAVRTSHYPYGPAFDLCDELGLYVADEVSAGWCPTSDETLAPAFAQRAREMVRRDQNHPSIIIWAVGNENKQGPNNKVAADEIKKFDTSRPRLVSWRRAEESDVELDDLHYRKPADIAKANAEMPRRMTIPITYLENPNVWEARNGADFGCVDQWVHVMDRTWQEVWKDDHVPGSFLWEWQDRAVADKNEVHLYDYDPATGVNFVKIKGLTDAYRNVRPDYYHVKMVYAPIKLEPKAEVSGSFVTLHADNRFSFTDLSEINAVWHLRSEAKELKSATAHLALPPRSKGDLKLDLPADSLSQADVLRLDLNHADGRNLATYDFPLKPERDRGPVLDNADYAGIMFPKLNFSTVTFGNNTIGWRTAYRHFAKLTNISVKKAAGESMPVADEPTLAKMSLADVHSMDADMSISGDPALVPENPKPAARRNKQYKSSQPTDPDLKVDRAVAHVHAEFAGGRFSYRIDWLAPDGDVQEMGWTFAMPKSFDRFSWHRQAYWSYYPENHIGRSQGTARPDAMNVRIGKITRPDAYDFNSTKYDCDWVTLSDGSGGGIAARFTADGRQHCRSGVADDGSYQLIINKQCSPPRDISSNVVPELYLVIKKGKSVESGFNVGMLKHEK